MADLLITIKEDLTLNNKQQGGIYQNTISGISDIYKRLVTVPSGSDTTLASFKSTVGIADAALDVGNVKYIRISNIDANSVNLSLQMDNESDDSAADASTTLLLEGGKSFMMGSTTSSVHTDDDSANLITSLSNLESIAADSGANNVRLEVFIASNVSGSDG